MSKLLVNLALLQTKALVNAYTWTTLPFYACVQRPWTRLRAAKHIRVQTHVDKHGRTVYSRPTPPGIDHQYLRFNTFGEIIPTLDRNRRVVGVRDVLREHRALDPATGQPVKIDGRELTKMELSPEFRWFTVGEVLDRVDAIARGLMQLGVRKGDKVLIYADNGVDWFYTSLALVRVNAITVTLFSTLGDSGVVFGVNQCNAKYVITSENLLPKLNKLGDQFDQLNTIVYIPNRRKAEPNTPATVEALTKQEFRVMSTDELENKGRAVPECVFETPAPDDTFLIMYTSGTTGNPKGVMLTHKQFSTAMHNMLRMDLENDSLAFKSVFAGYLPMAHLFGYLMNLGMFISDSRIAFCSPLTLLDSSPAHVANQVGDIKLIRPEFLVAVPLVLERILKEIYRKLNDRSPLAAPLFTYLMDYKIRWTGRGFDTPLLNRLVCRAIQDQFGGRLKLIGVSSAPLHERTQALIQAALNVKVVQAYGSTEMSGGSHVLQQDDQSYGVVGVPYHSFQYYLKDWPEGGYSASDKPNPRGEVVVGGDTIASGYYKLTEETEEAFYVDEDGVRWFHSGDIGEVLPNGTLKIIDRKKDLTKLANGEFVSLGKIESGLRNSAFVENICVCTNPYSNHVVALISPNRRALIELVAHRFPHKGQLSFEQICTDADVHRHVFHSIQSLCTELGFKLREVPVAIELVKEEWSQENNLLTAAFKLKRKQVNDFYSTQIKHMFDQLVTSGTEEGNAHNHTQANVV